MVEFRRIFARDVQHARSALRAPKEVASSRHAGTHKCHSRRPRSPRGRGAIAQSAAATRRMLSRTRSHGCASAARALRTGLLRTGLLRTGLLPMSYALAGRPAEPSPDAVVDASRARVAGDMRVAASNCKRAVVYVRAAQRSAGAGCVTRCWTASGAQSAQSESSCFAPVYGQTNRSGYGSQRLPGLGCRLSNYFANSP